MFQQIDDTMAVVQNNVWSSRAVIDGVYALHAFLLIVSLSDQKPDVDSSHPVDFAPIDGTLPGTMPQHSKLHKRQSHPFKEEYLPNGCRDVRERISNASNDNILEQRGTLHKRRLLLLFGEVTLTYELVGHSNY